MFRFHSLVRSPCVFSLFFLLFFLTLEGFVGGGVERFPQVQFIYLLNQRG